MYRNVSKGFNVKSQYFLCTLITILFTANLNATNLPQYNLLNLNLEDLTKLQVTSVANRYETDTQQSASAVTVITREEIERHGYKTLKELLNSVVGFDEGYHPRRSLVSNRGFVQDINTNYLLLIDGHRLNEKAYAGFGMAQIYPMMDNIKKVEVIRGPSSTLWGSSALNGIISITTMNATDYAASDKEEGVSIGSMDYEFEEKRTILNATYAKSTRDYDFTFSTLYFNSEVEPSRLYGYGVAEDTPYSMLQTNYNFNPSYQIQSKLRYKDISLHFQHTDYDRYSNGETLRYTDEEKTLQPTSNRDSDGLFRLNQTWGEIVYTPHITKELSLESRLSYDYTQKKETREYLDNSSSQTGAIYTDKGISAEIILHQDTDNFHFLGGIFGQEHKLINNIYLPSRIYKIISTETFASFAEFNYHGFKKWIFTVGARYEHASPRGNEYTILPRAMIYRQLNKNSYIKYMYNTGSLRPTLITTRDYVVTTPKYGTFYAQGAQKSQKSFSHSIQAGYRNTTFNITATLFYDKIKDLILWGNSTVVGQTANRLDIRLWETNLADITQKGVELEAKWHLRKDINFYSTYAYAKATYDNQWISYEGKPITNIDGVLTDDSMVMAGAPSQTWNLGVDWDLRTNIAWNINYHGRYGVLSRHPDPNWKLYGFEHFFDTNIRIIHPKLKNSELDIYGKNLTDNRGRFPIGNGEVETQTGREIGLRLKVTF
jgi:iron complex outermembrane receptor protein